jgi:hypothetical protein
LVGAHLDKLHRLVLWDCRDVRCHLHPKFNRIQDRIKTFDIHFMSTPQEEIRSSETQLQRRCTAEPSISFKFAPIPRP